LKRPAAFRGVAAQRESNYGHSGAEITMTHDIVIKGGTIVDGTGAEPFAADLAIDDGRITAIEKDAGAGHEVIDARGLIVSPGFIDIHTHLDAQIGWDPDLTPVSWHGVTTALLGNCGVTFAPCKSADRELLAGMMETVEDSPGPGKITAATSMPSSGSDRESMWQAWSATARFAST
jgi:N-acyl-D-aspartate/D-glutamate deacylase